MKEPHTDPGECAWQWRDPDEQTGSYEFNLADLWAPAEIHQRVLDCLELLSVGEVGHPEEMMSELAWDLVSAPDEYLAPFTTEELAPLFSADLARTRELALQLLGRIQQPAQEVKLPPPSGEVNASDFKRPASASFACRRTRKQTEHDAVGGR